MIDIPGFLSILLNIPKVLEEIGTQVKRTRGKKRSLLLEMEQNILTIKLYTDKGVPIDKVIGNLRTEKLEKAFEDNFNFNKFSGDKVNKKTTGGVAYYRRYIGWKTTALFKKLLLKIRELQDIVKLDTNNPNIRKSVRLLNILKLIKLILVHIN